MRALARLLFAGVIVLLSSTGLHAQTIRTWVYTNGGIVPAFDSGEVPCPLAGCVGTFTAAGVDGLTISGSVQGQGLPNGRRLRVFGVTATKSTPTLPAGTIDVVACYYNFNVVAPNYLFTVLNGWFSNAVGDGTIHAAEIRYMPERNHCDARGGPYVYNFATTGFTPPNPPGAPGIVPFFQTQSSGAFFDQVVQLGATVHIVVSQSGDTVNINTTSADVTASTLASVPALGTAGKIILVAVILLASAVLIRRRLRGTVPTRVSTS